VQPATETKYMVLADGNTAPDNTPLSQLFLPPTKLYEWLDQFTADEALGQAQSSNLLWHVPNQGNLSTAEANLGLRGARFRSTYVRTTGNSDAQIASMRELRDSIASAGIPGSFPYMFAYIFYEQYAIIRKETFTNLSLALVAVLVITTILIASFHASFMVIINIILVDIDILGLMNMWDLTIDSVSIINLVLAVGLSVDYSSHVAHAFVVAKGTKQERADQALGEMGTAVVHGAASTFAAVLVLSSSQSYIFRAFFKQFFGICVFGAAHGLIFLPVLLSLVGPDEIDAGHPAVASAKPAARGHQGLEMQAVAPDVEVAATPATETPPSLPPSPPSSRHGSRNEATSAVGPIRAAWAEEEEEAPPTGGVAGKQTV